MVLNNTIVILVKGTNMNLTYITTKELAERIHYNERTIRNQLKDSVLIEGIHYIRPLVVAKFYMYGSVLKKI